MENVKSCNACEKEMLVIENILLESDLEKEDALCCYCGVLVVTKEISGWYSVQVLTKDEEEKTCLFPMA